MNFVKTFDTTLNVIATLMEFYSALEFSALLNRIYSYQLPKHIQTK